MLISIGDAVRENINDFIRAAPIEEWCERQKGTPFSVATAEWGEARMEELARTVIEDMGCPEGVLWQEVAIITGFSVQPHLDPEWDDRAVDFLNISLHSSHEYGVFYDKELDIMLVRTGDVFFVETGLMHWFSPVDFEAAPGMENFFALLSIPVRRPYGEEVIKSITDDLPAGGVRVG